jgi:hypothetical protein
MLGYQLRAKEAEIMTKTEIKKHIFNTYSDMQGIVLRAVADNLKNGEFYGWIQSGKKMKLTNNNGDYRIQEAEQ